LEQPVEKDGAQMLFDLERPIEGEPGRSDPGTGPEDGTSGGKSEPDQVARPCGTSSQDILGDRSDGEVHGSGAGTCCCQRDAGSREPSPAGTQHLRQRPPLRRIGACAKGGCKKPVNGHRSLALARRRSRRSPHHHAHAAKRLIAAIPRRLPILL
jgi:hypothetical protein